MTANAQIIYYNVWPFIDNFVDPKFKVQRAEEKKKKEKTMRKKK